MKGMIERPNGDKLRGEFIHGKLHGKGTYESKSKRSVYNGNFTYGEKDGLGEETFFDKKKQPLARFSGFFRNGQRSGIGILCFRDTGYTSVNGKDELNIFGPWLAGNPVAGGMIANLEEDSSIPTTNRPNSVFKLLSRFHKVEARKDSSALCISARSEMMDIQYRLAIEMKKKEIFNDHYQSIFERDLSSNSKFQPPSKSSHYMKQNLSIGPRSLEEAENDPGLKHRLSQAETFRERMVKFAELEAATIECDHMKHIHNEFELMQERWDTIHIDGIRVGVPVVSFAPYNIGTSV